MTKFNIGDKVKLSRTHPWNTATFPNLTHYFGPYYMDAVFTVTKVNSIGSVSLKRDGFDMNQAWKFSAERFDAAPENGTRLFKVGDKVRRVKDYHQTMKPGDIGTVKAASAQYQSSTGNQGPYQTLDLEEHGIGHASYNLELVVEEKVEPTHGQGDYILIVMKNGRLAPASTPTVYSSWSQAKAVALSMSDKNPGNDFVIFKKIAEVSAPVPVTPKAELKLVA